MRFTSFLLLSTFQGETEGKFKHLPITQIITLVFESFCHPYNGTMEFGSWDQFPFSALSDISVKHVCSTNRGPIWMCFGLFPFLGFYKRFRSRSLNVWRAAETGRKCIVRSPLGPRNWLWDCELGQVDLIRWRPICAIWLCCIVFHPFRLPLAIECLSVEGMRLFDDKSNTWSRPNPSTGVSTWFFFLEKRVKCNGHDGMEWISPFWNLYRCVLLECTGIHDKLHSDKWLLRGRLKWKGRIVKIRNCSFEWRRSGRFHALDGAQLSGVLISFCALI